VPLCVVKRMPLTRHDRPLLRVVYSLYMAESADILLEGFAWDRHVDEVERQNG
jgi:hypothetical protein